MALASANAQLVHRRLRAWASQHCVELDGQRLYPRRGFATLLLDLKGGNRLSRVDRRRVTTLVSDATLLLFVIGHGTLNRGHGIRAMVRFGSIIFQIWYFAVLSQSSCISFGDFVSKAPVLSGARAPFIEQSAVQRILAELKLPLLFSSSSEPVVVEDDTAVARPEVAARDLVAANDDVAAVVDLEASDGAAEEAAGEADGLQLAAVGRAKNPYKGARVPVSELVQLTQEDFRQMPQGRCVAVAAQACAALARARAETKLARAQSRRSKNQLAIVSKKAKAKPKSANMNSCLVLQTKGKTGRRLTAQSHFSVAVRRNFSTMAACDFGAVVLHDISAATVLRAETKAGAALQSHVREVAADLLEPAREAAEAAASAAADDASALEAADCTDVTKEPWWLAAVCLRCDATNSSIWRREKLHVLEAELGVVTGPVTAEFKVPVKIRRALQLVLSLVCSPVRTGSPCYFI